MADSDNFDRRLIEWELHPLMRLVQKQKFKLLKSFLANERRNSFGVDTFSLAHDEFGRNPMMATLLTQSDHEVRRAIIFQLLKLFHLDVNEVDDKGRPLMYYAITTNSSIDLLDFLIKNGADMSLMDHQQMTPLMYAVGLERWDFVRLMCTDTSVKLKEALRNKFGTWDNLSGRLRSPRKDFLEIPFPTEGSPKRFLSPSDSPYGGTPVNGIRVRVSPTSPSNASSSPFSTVSTGNHPASRRSSTERRFERKVLRRICSAVFDWRLWNKASGALQFAQLTHNLAIYLQEADADDYLDKLPEARDEEEGELDEMDENSMEERPRRISINGLPPSAPILIKSRSVEDSINNKQHGTPPFMRNVFIKNDKSWRKNALHGTHLIERQGSAPQLQLKRKPRPYSETSSESTSPVGSLSRNATRPQITVSPLVTKLATHGQK